MAQDVKIATHTPSAGPICVSGRLESSIDSESECFASDRPRFRFREDGVVDITVTVVQMFALTVRHELFWVFLADKGYLDQRSVLPLARTVQYSTVTPKVTPAISLSSKDPAHHFSYMSSFFVVTADPAKPVPFHATAYAFAPQFL